MNEDKLKIMQFEDFSFGPGMRFWSNIWKWGKFFNSVPYINTPDNPSQAIWKYISGLGREFQRSFKFDIEVDPCVPTFGGNLGYYWKIFEALMGKQVW